MLFVGFFFTKPSLCSSAPTPETAGSAIIFCRTHEARSQLRCVNKIKINTSAVSPETKQNTCCLRREPKWIAKLTHIFFKYNLSRSTNQPKKMKTDVWLIRLISIMNYYQTSKRIHRNKDASNRLPLPATLSNLARFTYTNKWLRAGFNGIVCVIV